MRKHGLHTALQPALCKFGTHSCCACVCLQAKKQAEAHATRAHEAGLRAAAAAGRADKLEMEVRRGV